MSDRTPWPSWWPTGPNNREETGPIGDGTPHARMCWFWERMRQHEELIAELTGWSPLSSSYRFEAAIADAFDKLANSAAASPDPRGEVCKKCGELVAATCPTWWTAPDELWNEVEGGPGGIRCIRCFTEDCGERGICVRWEAVVDSRRDRPESPDFVARANKPGRWTAAQTPKGEEPT